MSRLAIFRRHDGHHDKDQGYYTRNNGLVKQIFPGVVVTIVMVLAMHRLIRFLSKRRYGRMQTYHFKG